MELYGSLHNISGSVTASAFSGSFIGDGSGLVGIQASGVTGLNLSQIANADATASISSSGFTVNKNTQIQGNLAVSGAIIANEYIVSSSVVYMTTSYASGSSAFGDDVMDTHTFSGSVNIRGSISLNGSAVGTGKLDETTFQSYTSSNNSRVSALETSSGSLNSFTSSINTTIKDKLDDENVVSGSIQIEITGTTGYSTFSSSISSSIGSLSSSIATTTNDIGGRVSLLETASGSIRTDFNSYTSSNDSTNTTQNNKLGFIETSTGSLNSFTSSINTTIKSKLDNDGVISGSVQVNITGTTGYSTFSSNSINILSSSVDTLSSSFNVTITGLTSNLTSLSSSVATTTSGLTSTITSLSSSLTSSIGVVSSSVDLLSSSVATTTLNLKNRVDSIETTTSSLNSFTSSINATIKSKLDNDGVISGSMQVNVANTTGYSTFSSSIATTTSGLTSTITSLSSSVATTTSGLTSTITSVSSSVATTTSDLSSSIGSLSSSVATTTSGLTSNINSLSSSVATTTSGLSGTITSLSSSVSSSIGNLSSSVATTTSNIQSRATSLESKTGSYATTGSNVFQGDQTITGSLYISQNLIIAGSSSIQNISSSVLNIADNIITVNAVNPSVRFGGLAVIDSGSSPQVSGSILFDSVNNQWLFVHQNQGTVTSSVLLMGPETYNNLGNETYITTNRLVKSTGIEHLTNSNISDDGSTVTILSNTVINGTITSTGTTIVSGSSQISHDSTTGYVANKHIDHTAVSITAGNGLSGGGDISATRTVSLDTASATFTSGVKSKMNTDGVISGSSQISYGGITGVPSGLVSGSSQITYGGLTSIPSGIVSGSSQITFGSISSIPSGLVSGSSQITLTSGQVTSGLGYTPYNATNPNGYITGINSSAVTTALGFTPYNATNPSGYITGISFANVSSKPTTLSGYGITDAVVSRGTSWNDGTVIGNTVGMLAWKNYGNGHVIFDASAGTSPSGASINNTNPSANWTGTYPTLMGWNGSQTYGVRVDSARVADSATTAGSLTSMNISQFTNNSGYITGINSSAVTTALGYTPYNATNPNGYITGISFANVSSKPTTISGYGITDAITTGNIGSQSVSNASTVANLTPSQFFNNMGDSHATRTSFDASTPSYNFGFRYVQGNTNGPATGGGGQFYSWYLGLGNDYPATGAGSYGMHVAIARGATTPYMSVRYNENNSLGSWIKIAAGYADTAGALSSMNISQFTNNSGYATLSGSNSFSNSYNEFGDGTGSVSNDGSWNGRLNIAGSQHARLDVVSVSDGIITTMFSHIGQGVGRVGTYSNHPLSLMVNGSGRISIDTSGHLLPNSNNVHNLGSPSLGWANVYTNDLHLSNMNKPEGNDVDGTNGTWTIQEGAENLYIINNNNGKKFKISLEEIK